MLKSIGLIIVGLLVGFGLWVRLAPSDPARWHVAPPSEPKQFSGGVNVIVPGDMDLLRRLEQVALASPRTQLLAGSVDDRRLTFVTRSALWGFPDYTTIALTDGQITLFGRLRFGRSDLGVNAARIQGWLQSAQAVEGAGGRGADG